MRTNAGQTCEEPRWLKEVCTSIDKDVLGKLVSHRGFHDGNNGTSRPLENTLAAYTSAWAAGVKNCECDVSTTKDDVLVLHHDTGLKRLATDDAPAEAEKSLRELRFMDVQQIPLRDGSYTARLIDTLSNAEALSGQLVLELKPGTSVPVLVEFFVRNPGLVTNVPAVISFHKDYADEFQQEYKGRVKGLVGAEVEDPKVMLLTLGREASRTPNTNHEYLIPSEDLDTIVSDKTTQDTLKGDLDGLYVEWDEKLITTHKEAFGKLCSNMDVGVWFSHEDEHDKYEVASELVSLGVKFVNTDFPKSFFVC